MFWSIRTGSVNPSVRRLIPEKIGHAVSTTERRCGRPRPALTLLLTDTLLLGHTLAGPIIALACQGDDTAHVIDANADVDSADDSDDIDPLPVSVSEALPLTWLPPAAFSTVEFGGLIPHPRHPPATPPPILG